METLPTLPHAGDFEFRLRRQGRRRQVCLHDRRDGRELARLTRGARSVLLAGPRRRFAEPDAAAAVTHAHWVRALPQPFDGEPAPADLDWLARALAANASAAPDVLAIALQYLRGALPVEEGGLRVAGDARYGPLRDGRREEGSDFNDYLGLDWSYPEGQVDRAEPRQLGCLDCSGFVRMVWGLRRHAPTDAGLPLGLRPREDRSTLPRRANELFESAPGVVLFGHADEPPSELDALQPGDLLFFDADENDGERLDHVGMLLGLDADGHPRFVSSRKAANGPTFGDYRGRSILDGDGLYAQALRAARRL